MRWLNKLSEIINAYMMENSLSGEELSKILGLDIDYLYRLTIGDNTIDVLEYRRVISQLGLIT